MATRKRRRNRTAGGEQRGGTHRRGRRGLYWFCALLAVAAVAAVLSLTVFFRINSIKADTGDTPYSSDEIISACGISKGKNLWLADTKAACERIEAEFPYAETVKIARRLPGTLIITLKRPEIEVTCDNGTEARLISGRGRVLGDASGGASYLIEGASFSGGSLDDGSAAKLADYNSVYRVLAENGLADKTGAICVGSLSDVYFIYDGRIKVQLGGLSDLEHKAAFFLKFMTEDSVDGEVGVFDVSGSEKAYFRPIQWDTGSQAASSSAVPDGSSGTSSGASAAASSVASSNRNG